MTSQAQIFRKLRKLPKFLKNRLNAQKCCKMKKKWIKNLCWCVLQSFFLIKQAILRNWNKNDRGWPSLKWRYTNIYRKIMSNVRWPLSCNSQYLVGSVWVYCDWVEYSCCVIPIIHVWQNIICIVLFCICLTLLRHSLGHIEFDVVLLDRLSPSTQKIELRTTEYPTWSQYIRQIKWPPPPWDL